MCSVNPRLNFFSQSVINAPFCFLEGALTGIQLGIHDQCQEMVFGLNINICVIMLLFFGVAGSWDVDGCQSDATGLVGEIQQLCMSSIFSCSINLSAYRPLIPRPPVAFMIQFIPHPTH